ncbi:MAG: choice-of-anchor D domain-containing protein [Planctomycetes bacterium]|nr:choice-of-anchor D domain-containing protein [Planctomycetota bacterium]
MRYVILAAISFLFSGCATLTSNVSKHDFGKIYVGQTATSPNVTWKNGGNDKVAFIGVAGDWTAGSPFSLQPSPYTARDLSKNGVSNPVQVVFAPLAVGTFKGKIEPLQNVGFGKSATANVVSVQGEAVAQLANGALGVGGAAITVGKPLDFGRVKVNIGPASSKRVDVVNTSNQAIQVQARFKSGGQGFAINSPGATFTIPAGRKVTVKLTFLPTSGGIKWDVIEFVDTANGKNVAGVVLTGEGTE